MSYLSRSGVVAPLHRLGFEHRKPEAVPSKMDPEQQRRFIAAYEKLLNRLEVDEIVLFADAVHPTLWRRSRSAAGCPRGWRWGWSRPPGASG